MFETISITGTAIVILATLIWLLAGFLNLRSTLVIPSLHKINPPDPNKWPVVSLIITARNEATTIEDAVLSRLDCDYPDLEIILINDRSTDTTGEIIDRIAKTDGRVIAVHIDELPDGWVGKPHAMHIGTSHASGEILLFSDADVHFSQNAIRKAVSYMEHEKLDQLGVAPALWSKNFLVNIMHSTFMRSYGYGAGLWGADLDWVPTYTGVGAFNMVRRSAYDKSKGFEWLKMELADDVGTGFLIKKAGGKTGIVVGSIDVTVDWYDSIAKMFTGLEKVAFTTVGQFSFIRALLFVTAYLLLDFTPVIFLALFSVPWVQAISVFLLLLMFTNAIGMNRWLNGPVLPALLWPFGTVLFAVMLIRGNILGLVRGGIMWRGTFYPTDKLKAERRVRLL